jgi:hypothetical protein
VLVGSIWISSYFMGDWIQYYDPTRPLYVHAGSSDGRIDIGWRHGVALYDAGWDSSLRTGTFAGHGSSDLVVGFRFDRAPDGAAFLVPHWFITLLVAAPAAFAWRRRMRIIRAARRGANGMCPECGYDVRVTPGQCPECGAGIEASCSIVSETAVGDPRV